MFEVTDDDPRRLIQPAVKGGSSRPSGRRHPWPPARDHVRAARQVA